jgi:hypothetical protein
MTANLRILEVNYLRKAVHVYCTGGLVACCPFPALLQAVQLVIGPPFPKLLIEALNSLPSGQIFSLFYL